MAEAIELATAYVSLAISAEKVAPQVNRELRKVEDQADRTGKSAGKKMSGGMKAGVAGAATKIFAPLAAAAAAVGVGNLLGDALGEAREAQKVGAVTEQIIKATGGAARVTAADVGKLAESISNKTGVDDEAIQSSANLLLTFKNVKNEVGDGANVFDRATLAAQDMAAAGFGDANGAAKMLGKALNDPLKGITALGRAGVTFTEQQKEQIKTLVESGDTLGAQKLIMAEVETQVGGVAAASATAGEKLAVTWGNFKEQLGTALLPVLDKVQTFLADKVIPAVSGFVAGIEDGTGAGGRFRGIVTGIWDAVKTAFTWVRDNALPVIQGFIEEFRNGEGAGGKFRDILTRVWGAAKTAFGWLRDNALPVLLDLADFVMKRLWPDIKAAFLDRILPAMEEVGRVIKAAWETVIRPALSALWVFVRDVLAPFLVDFYENGIKPTFKLIGDAISGAWNKVIKPTFNYFRDGFANLKRWVNDAKDGIARGWQGLVNAIARPINAVIDKINAFLTNLKDGLNKIPGVNIEGSWTIRKIILGTSSATVGGNGRAMLAAGGTVPGWSPNDRADNIPAMLTAGEYVLPVAATRSLSRRFGPGFLEALRSGLPGFASGGPVSHGNKRTGGFLADSWEWLADVFKDAKGWVKGKIESLIGGFGESWPGMAAKGAARSTAGGIGDWIMANAFGGGSASGGSRANYGGKYGWAPQGLPWQSIWSLIRLVAPEATMTSNFRPGAITASGVPSLHGQGRAVDIVSPNMRATFLKILPLLKWSQLFHSPMGGAQIGYRDAIVHRTHFDHIHAALADGGLVKPFVADSGALLKPGLNLLDNRTGGPEPLVRGDRDLRLADDQIDEWLDGLRDIMRTENRRLVDMMVSADR